MGMGMIRWEWEGNGNKKVIPAHLYTAQVPVFRRTTHINLAYINLSLLILIVTQDTGKRTQLSCLSVPA